MDFLFTGSYAILYIEKTTVWKICLDMMWNFAFNAERVIRSRVQVLGPMLLNRALYPWPPKSASLEALFNL